MLLIATVLTLLAASPALALEPGDVTVIKDERGYLTQLEFTVAAGIGEITAVLTDYEHPERLTPAVTERRVVARSGDSTRVRTDIHGCIVFFCKDLVLTQDVTISGGTISADIVPEESDFRSGYVRWVMSSNADGSTGISYESLLEPDFFVPPLIGRYFIRKWLKRQVYEIAGRLVAEVAADASGVPGS